MPVGVGRNGVQRSQLLRVSPRARRRSAAADARTGRALARLTFFAALQSRTSACDLRSSGASPRPAAIAALGVVRQPLPLEPDLSLVGHVQPVDEPQQLGPAGAHQAAEADDLARAHLKAGAPDRGEPPDVLHVQEDLVRARGALGIELLDLAADHQLDQPVDGSVRRQPGRGGPAVRQHGHAAADAPDLVEAVRDVDDARRRPRSAAGPRRRASRSRRRPGSRRARP